MDTITLTIDGIEVKASKGKRILEAALDAGIYIPNLCALRDIKLPFGACRLCQVEIEGKRGTVTACSEPAVDGMVVHSNTPELNNLRRNILEIMLARHPSICLTCHRRERCRPGDICLRLVDVTDEQCVLCPKNGRCELQRVVDFIGLSEMPFPYTSKELPVERENPFIVRNNNLCILCGRCVRVCGEVLGVEAIAFNQRGANTVVSGNFNKPLIESGCIFCGSCVEVCPTGALMDRGDEWERWPNREAASVRCKYACPAGVDVPRFIRFIVEGSPAEALAVIRESVPLASICSRICPHPCEDECRRGDLNEPIAIRALERFAVDQADSRRFIEETMAETSGRKVAIIGSGPAGLTAAYYLARKGGHSVVIFESLTKPGGMMREIKELPVEILDAEIMIITGLGVRINTQTEIESLDGLFEQGYDAIFLTESLSDITEGYGLKAGSGNIVLVDPDTLISSRKGIYAGGEAISEASSFIEGVADGRKAAISIDLCLGGNGNIREILAPVEEGMPRVGMRPDFSKKLRNHKQLEAGFTGEAAVYEARRCMNCDLRFRVAEMVSQPPAEVRQEVSSL